MSLALHLLNSAAMMAAIALIYGIVQRLTWPDLWRNTILGMIFGAGAVISMLQPLSVGAGAVVDSRNLFMGFAGAFLGPVGALVAVCIGTIGRFTISFGSSALVGVASMAVAAGMGALWHPVCHRLQLKGAMKLPLLGAMISVSLLSLLWLPASLEAWRGVEVALSLAAYNVVGSLVLGGFVQREGRLARRERKMLEHADTDPLTGLLNRRTFESRYRAANSQRDTRGTSLILVDLDHFKSINDTYGHDVGDEILRHVARTLQVVVRAKDSVLRIGGEEFAVLLPDLGEAQAQEIAARLCAAISMTCRISDQLSVPITASIGGAHCRSAAIGLAQMSREADQALYEAKRQGRNRAVFFSRHADAPMRQVTPSRAVPCLAVDSRAAPARQAQSRFH